MVKSAFLLVKFQAVFALWKINFEIRDVQFFMELTNSFSIGNYNVIIKKFKLYRYETAFSRNILW